MAANGCVIKEYVSLKEAATEYGVMLSSIHKAINLDGRTCKGYKWKYAS
jgi:hypothetical protein